MAMTPLVSSHDYRSGRCGGFDGETTCGQARLHGGGCRFYDPSGTGRWIEKDDEGVELARGGPWAPDVSADATLGGLLGSRPPSRYVEDPQARPPTCGELGPAALGARRGLCGLAVDHGGMHRAADGSEWTPPSPVGEWLLEQAAGGWLPAAELDAPMRAADRLLMLTAGSVEVLVGVMDTPELAAAVAVAWNTSTAGTMGA